MYAPHALPMFREEQNSKKRKERSDRKDPVRSKKPDPPVSQTPGRAFRFSFRQPHVVLMRCLVRVWETSLGLHGTGACFNLSHFGLLHAYSFKSPRLQFVLNSKPAKVSLRFSEGSGINEEGLNGRSPSPRSRFRVGFDM